ncbi:MAG: hypothetical protein D8M62_12290 [Proteobacteria bacterium]|nr:hypothetical protein [Pseudomonadota bacterium]
MFDRNRDFASLAVFALATAACNLLISSEIYKDNAIVIMKKLWARFFCPYQNGLKFMTILKLIILNIVLTIRSCLPKRRPLPKVIHKYRKINGVPASLDM